MQLNGFVGTQAEKSAATKAAQGVSGVKEVRNNLEVKSTVMADADRSPGEVIDDATITAKVKTALIADETTKALSDQRRHQLRYRASWAASSIPTRPGPALLKWRVASVA